MSRLHWKDFENLAGKHFEKEFGMRLLPQWPVHLKNGQTHKFDFSSENERVVVQCKSYRWTKSGHYPNGKVAEAQMAIDRLQGANASRKIIVFDDDLNQKGQSFVEVFVRRNKDSLSGIEVWKHHDEKFELYFGPNDKPDPTDALAIDLATELLVDISHRARTELIVSFREIEQRLGITSETLHRVAGIIETGLKNQGIPAARERDSFRLKLEV
jgi:hypothetical protein